MDIHIDLSCKCLGCMNLEGKECYLYPKVNCLGKECPCDTPVHECEFGGKYIILEDE